MKLKQLFLLLLISLSGVGQTPVVWERIVPSSFTPETGQVQWADQVPDFTLPKGKIWVGQLGDWDVDMLLKKGVTHLSKFDIAPLSDAKIIQIRQAGKSYDDVPITPQQLGLRDRGVGASNWVPKKVDANGRVLVDANGNPTGEAVAWPGPWNERFFGKIQPGQTEPMSYQQGYEAGLRYPVDHSLVIFENSEQDHAVGTQWELWRGFYAAWMARMDNEWRTKGIIPVVGHNYFSGIQPLVDWMGGKDIAKKYIHNPIISGSAMLPGGTLDKTNLSCFGLYLGPPDISEDFILRLAFAGYANHSAGKLMTGFISPIHEWLPNNFRGINYPEGTLYKQEKIPITPAETMSLTAISFIFGDGLIPWSFSGKKTTKLLQREYTGGSLWYPKGSSQPGSLDDFPYWWKRGDPQVYYGYSGVEDYSGFTVYAVHKTFFQVEGGKPSFLTFRIDGGPWITKQDFEADNIVDAAYDKHGIVFSKVLNGKMAVLYVNPFADNKLRKLEFIDTFGKTYSGTVSTNAPWLSLINL